MASMKEILKQFNEQRSGYLKFADCVMLLLKNLLVERGIAVHSVTNRVKEVKSLGGKLKRKRNHYKQLDDITDLAGIRVILYLPEEVDKVGHLIDEEFRVDGVNSVDKRQSGDPAKFGYASLHKVCWLSDARLDMPEYSGHRRLRCEIQIRTVLQHAWAEIEHDLGYKSAAGLPEPLKRRFCRIAALLDTADEEFSRLKSDIELHAAQAQSNVSKAAPGISLDRDTLKAFVEQNELLRAVEAGVPSLGESSTEQLDWHLTKLRAVGVEHVDSLVSALKRHKEHIQKGVNRCSEVDYGENTEFCESGTEKGWSLWMLVQLLCADRPTKGETIEAFRAIELYIGDSMDAYAESLRLIVRDVDMSNRPVNTYGSVYLTLVSDGGDSGSYPMRFEDGKWIWDVVSLTNEGLVIEGKVYPIQSRNPLLARTRYKGKDFTVTE